MANEKIKILLVDDDMTSLDLMDLLFEDKGFNVVRCSDGGQAIAAAEKASPDIILVDLMMPGITGQEAVRQIRSQGINIPIVAFTALDDPDAHEEAIEAGCNLVLTKPCKPSDLIKHIVDLVQN